MAKRTRRTLRALKAAGTSAPSGKSKYARKRAYLNRTGLRGWEVPEPKPWRGKAK